LKLPSTHAVASVPLDRKKLRDAAAASDSPLAPTPVEHHA
jgi:hypothetical protein